MFSILRNFIEYKGELYFIIRALNEHNNPIIDTWKEHLNADLVLKRQGMFYFLKHVEEAKIIEEKPNNQLIKI